MVRKPRHHRRNAISRVAIPLCAVLVLACSGGGATDTFPPFSFRPAVSTESPSTGEIDSVIALLAGSSIQGGLLDSYWNDALAELGDESTYTPPKRVLSYPRGGSIDTLCTGDESGEKWIENAYYCPSDQTIAWERNWFSDMQDDIGELAPVGVIAHEWGHHIQDLTTAPTAKLSSENQADCYSGAFFRHADDEGWLDLYTPGGKVSDAVTAIYRLGNSKFVQSRWYSNYGPPRSRTLAFGTGNLALSPSVCLLYQDFEYRSALEFGWYTLDPPPAFDVATRGENQVLSRDDITAEVRAYPDLGDQSAEEQFDAVTATWFGNAEYDWIDVAYVNPFGDRLGGTAAVRNYEQRLTNADGTTTAIHGDVVLQVDAGHGGILLDVYRLGPSPPDKAGWDQLIQWVAIIANGLCPGGVGTDVCPVAGGR